MRILVTRPEPEASRTAAQLQAMGHEVSIEPLLQFQVVRPKPGALTLDDVGAVALTSARALRSLEELGVLQQLLSFPIFTVGDRSAEEARAVGFERVYSASGTLEDLTALMARVGARGTVFYPCGQDLSGDLPKALSIHGIKCRGVVVYAMEPKARFSADTAHRLAAGEFERVLFYSQRTAHTFTQLMRLEKISVFVNSMKALCVSEKIAAALDGFAEVEIAREPTEAALLDLIGQKPLAD
ncbi:uroporphyrinogen-III synthase [Pseudovibrio exalbescens]|uniref:uroporphyrinogen-III synthase n=1 Tax=Pseudovibrio exalbescens TaxID=197461 RepID=UPI0023670E29|nr:uroporphyrinogen-III synthase [Pseudovibrio exalbescens]MDD7911743.1 uroporphyrinogen-III synthase [Pseudovibrio exalbescens]